MRRNYGLFLLITAALTLSGCGAQEVSCDFPCHVVLEENEGYSAAVHALTVPRGEDAVFTLTEATGLEISGVDYDSYTLTTADDGLSKTLTLHNVRYSGMISVQTQQIGLPISYSANGGERLNGGAADELVTQSVLPTHLRLNTSIGVDLFSRDGYTLVGWNTEADGSGLSVGLGSRIAWSEGLTLYAQWVKWTDPSLFAYETQGDVVTITDYFGQEEMLVIPAQLEGLPVRSITDGACAGGSYTRVILPNGLYQVEGEAFADSAVEEVWLSDDIRSITDYAFAGCDDLTTLHINAVEPPVYSGNYFDTFADKYDRLLSLKTQKKLVLFSGSSTRFGYDSEAIDRALPDYAVVNMGVFAYTSAYPQLLLILDCMQEGDILLHSPEFDAAQRQFCTKTELSDDFFCMMESNYDIVAALNLRQVSSVFGGLTSYLNAKSDMTPKRYELSASQFDEDGHSVDTPSYNAYGDYILERPNADSDEPVYGLPVDYTVRSFPYDSFLLPYNHVCQRFLDKGIHFYFTYAPRNQFAISQDSTPEARSELDKWFREKLIVPVISPIEESLYPGRYLYGTDNHLSTEGVRIRTERILVDLKAQIAQDGLLEEVAGA